MKKLTMMILIFTMAFGLTKVWSQVIVQMEPFPPYQFELEDLWEVTLINNTPAPIEAYLQGTINEADAGMIFQIITNPVILEPGINRMDNSSLGPMEIMQQNTDYVEMIARTGSLPEGDYEMCILVIDQITGIDVGEGCMSHTVAQPSPPMVTLPEQDAQVIVPNPVFAWTQPYPLPPGLRPEYRITLTEILPGQVSEEALTVNPVWYQGETDATTLTYPMSARPLNAGNCFVYQVSAFSGSWEIGNSEIMSFCYQPGTVPGVPEAYGFAPNVLLDGGAQISNHPNGIIQLEVTYTEREPAITLGTDWEMQVNGGPWMTFAPLMPITLGPSPGTYTVTVILRDYEGRITQPGEASIFVESPMVVPGEDIDIHSVKLSEVPSHKIPWTPAIPTEPVHETRESTQSGEPEVEIDSSEIERWIEDGHEVKKTKKSKKEERIHQEVTTEKWKNEVPPHNKDTSEYWIQIGHDYNQSQNWRGKDHSISTTRKWEGLKPPHKLDYSKSYWPDDHKLQESPTWPGPNKHNTQKSEFWNEHDHTYADSKKDWGRWHNHATSNGWLREGHQTKESKKWRQRKHNNANSLVWVNNNHETNKSLTDKRNWPKDHNMAESPTWPSPRIHNSNLTKRWSDSGHAYEDSKIWNEGRNKHKEFRSRNWLNEQPPAWHDPNTSEKQERVQPTLPNEVWPSTHEPAKSSSWNNERHYYSESAKWKNGSFPHLGSTSMSWKREQDPDKKNRNLPVHNPDTSKKIN